MTGGDYAAQASLHRAALLLGLTRGAEVIAWADAVLARDEAAPAAFVEVAATPPEELTALRVALLALCDHKESPEIVGALVGLVHRDLASGRRSFNDTMTVLKQLRAFVSVDREVNERLKALGVDVAMSPAGSAERAAAEQRVREFLERGGV